MVTIGYKILFTINILHEYYADWQSKDTVVTPTKATQQILKNYKLIYKPTAMGCVILAQITDEAGTLKIPIDDPENFKLVFYLNATSPYFYNRTNLPIPPTQVTDIIPNKKAYYFDNRSIQSFNASNIPGNFPNPQKYLSEGGPPSVGLKDEIIYLPFTFKTILTTAKALFQVIVTKEDGSTVTIPVNSEEQIKIHQINLKQKLSSGFFKIKIDGGTEQQIYLSDEAFHQAPLGVIEIAHSSNVNPDDRFILADKIVQQDYYLWFKNRELKWRYVYQMDIPGSIKKTGDILNFTKTEKTFDSPNPIGLFDSYTEIKDNKGKKLPNPDGKTIKPTGDDTKYYTEIHL
ncbi:MAG TPA: hypothetical protein ENK75_04270 [Saprospiraceae bacterium]|nr:hypothetical protein [Saprospiraceae bacterium]